MPLGHMHSFQPSAAPLVKVERPLAAIFLSETDTLGEDLFMTILARAHTAK